MGARGPLPKSGETRKREGNPAHRPIGASNRSGFAVDVPERPRGMSASAARLWDLYAPDLASKGPFHAAWVPGLAAACEFESDLLQDERRYRIEQRRSQKKAKSAGSEFVKSREDWLEKRELLARRRVLAQMKEQFVLTPKADSRFQAGESGGMAPMVASSGVMAAGEETINDPYSIVQ